jgi:hypothetical protein
MPASNLKLYTAALALQALGASRTFTTRVVTNNFFRLDNPSTSNDLPPDVALDAAVSDATVSERTSPPSSTLPDIFSLWAAAIHRSPPPILSNWPLALQRPE